jgi:hypothetical protein
MNEDKLKALLQQDQSLRDAIRQDEAERPQMPADLNARVLQRMSVLSGLATESDGKTARNKRRRLWPWLAAACVAGVLVVLLMPPKETTTTGGELATTDVVITTNNDSTTNIVLTTTKTTKTTTTTIAALDSKPATSRIHKRSCSVVLSRKAEATDSNAEENELSLLSKFSHGECGVALSSNKTSELSSKAAESKPETLTERDIPITRPENYQYTPEEIALLKKQANEAYLKWVELELEIAKHNQEQTAQY